ncbi:biotin--[acetyl-CoA-carboxylase] ligase [Hujiaoplasma nucleasis]|uniref:Biotin--[acetyl-CoA-carboxylase] ligase n=1 Tax=Hujiaoplasma nucleasis TaxID=2725268 RepID=A0A7L6N2V5_9MOLU|nr:biotin--[acetyl-CoA-carboxylase] ligase [Hujiaoplasma nucleasis]QLY39881.1 biotin--[acetyl-CoA-carboxylase] ligase [Hujiaoplasma nucleasis]
MKTYFLDSVNSTNTYLKDHYQDYQHFDCILTHHQTQGKGRLVNTWFSTDKDLTFSILIKDKLSAKAIQLMPLYTAYILNKVISLYTEESFIKWPNDILIQGKKVSGILVESLYQDSLKALIIGIGINVNNNDFPNHIKNQAISLSQISQVDIKQDSLLLKIQNQFEKDYEIYKNDPTFIIKDLNQKLAYKNQWITYTENQKNHQAICKEINEDGHLMVETNHKKKILISSVIHHLRKN